MLRKQILSVIIAAFVGIAFSGCSKEALTKNETVASSSDMQNQTEQLKSSKDEGAKSKSDSSEPDNKTKPTTEVVQVGDSNKPQNTANNNDSKKIDKTNNNVKKADKKKVIVIDSGHGGKITSEKEPISPDSNTPKAKYVSGAAGISTKTPEHTVNLNVALKLEKYLIDAGYTVIMTHRSNSETIGNIERAEVGNKNNADLVVRIHADSSDDTSVKGASMLVPGEVGYAKDIAKISTEYGKVILNTLVKEVGMKSRGIVKRTDLTGFNWSKVPVVLIEMGFLSNSEEDKLLSSDSYQEKIALGLSKGVDEVFQNHLVANK